MKKKIIIALVLAFVLFPLSSAFANFPVSKINAYIGPGSLSPGDVLEVTYSSESSYGAGDLYITDTANYLTAIIKEKLLDNKGGQTTVTYTVLNDYPKWYLSTPGDSSIYNTIYSIKLNGIEIYPPKDVTNLRYTVNDTVSPARVSFYWDAVSNPDFSHYKLYMNGTLLKDNQASNLFLNFDIREFSTFKVTSVDIYGNESTGAIVKNDDDTEPPGDIQNISASPGEADVSFYYDLPTDDDFSFLRILRDGEIIVEEYKENYFSDTDLESNKRYEYTFISVDESGNESPGVSKVIVTLEKFIPLKDIEDLKAVPKYNRVNLSWNLPDSTEFKHVNIYRDELAEEPGFFQQLFAGASVSAAEEPTKIFETNGTYFNDLTVAPETTYEYKLTSQSTTGEETDGVTVQATTTEEPAPEMGDSGYTITPEGDYLYKWDSPTEGQVKVNIAGTDYKTVEASEGQIIIPKDQMKYTIFGDPDIRLYPVSPYGKEGEPFDSSKLFKDGMMPFGGQDLLKTGMSLLGVVGPLVLLGLSFLLFPKIRKIIFNSFSKRKERRG